MRDEDYATRYGFRAPRWNEPPDVYRRALIAHVRDRDFAAAHELETGRLQAAWTPADVATFKARLMAGFGAQRPLDGPLTGEIVILHSDRRVAPTEAGLLALADLNLDAAADLRRRQPHRPLMIFASVLMLTGDVLQCGLTERADRVVALRQMARNLPVFGYVLVFDAYVHRINETAGTASKVDALIAHVGTRDRRVMRTRPYRLDARGRLTWITPAPPDVDTQRPGGWTVEDDPYAAIFVSVPAPAGRPS